MNPQFYITLYGPESLNHKLFMLINHANHPALDAVMPLFIYLGGPWALSPYLAIMLAVNFARREWMPGRYIAVYAVAALVGNGIEEWLKELLQVPRPALAIGLDQIHVVGGVKLKNALPSGHALFSFVTAAALGHGRGKGWRIPLYSFAVLVAWSRVYVGAHYPLDVAAGALIGMAVGLGTWQGYELIVFPFLKKWGKGVNEKDRPS